MKSDSLRQMNEHSHGKLYLIDALVARDTLTILYIVCVGKWKCALGFSSRLIYKAIYNNLRFDLLQARNLLTGLNDVINIVFLVLKL